MHWQHKTTALTFVLILVSLLIRITLFITFLIFLLLLSNKKLLLLLKQLLLLQQLLHAGCCPAACCSCRLYRRKQLRRVQRRASSHQLRDWPPASSCSCSSLACSARSYCLCSNVATDAGGSRRLQLVQPSLLLVVHLQQHLLLRTSRGGRCRRCRSSLVLLL
jgi:hypothetical protein